MKRGTDHDEGGILVDKAESAKRTIPAPDQCERIYGCYTPPHRPIDSELSPGQVSEFFKTMAKVRIPSGDGKSCRVISFQKASATTPFTGISRLFPATICLPVKL
ncbi:MAG: hypothetical protein ACI92S_000919, partial [Planctomycetaceae bacterium]